MGYPKIRHTAVDTAARTTDLKNTEEYFEAQMILSKVNIPSKFEKANATTKASGTITKNDIHKRYGYKLNLVFKQHPPTVNF